MVRQLWELWRIVAGMVLTGAGLAVCVYGSWTLMLHIIDLSGYGVATSVLAAIVFMSLTARRD